MTVRQIFAVLLFGCGGMASLAVGGLFVTVLLFERASRKRSLVADGVVTGYLTEDTSEDGTRYDPVVKYHDAAGVEQTARVEGGVDKPFFIGQHVRVEYDTAFPSTAWIAGHRPEWTRVMAATVGVVVGLVAILTAAGIWLFRVPVE